MQIDVLRFKNINSLYGRWTIDFTQQEYRSQGIFAITGPTGSGKSTILDAVSLALFGRTPRQKQISETTNEIMSRDARECSAEMEFRIAGGKYRATWSQCRTGKKAKKPFRKVEYELIDANTGNILAANMKDFFAEIGNLLGNMNFDQFTRSILLAQGEFDGFLRADAKDRAPILERITGTEVYRNISLFAYQKAAAEKQKRDQWSAKTERIVLLDDEESVTLRRTLTEKRQQEKELETQIEALEARIDSLETVAKLERDIASYREELATVRQAETEFQDRAAALQFAKKAARIDADHALLRDVRASLGKHSVELDEKEREIRETDREFRALQSGLENDTKTLLLRETAFERMQDTWKTVRLADRDIELARKELDDARRELEKSEQEYTELGRSLRSLELREKEHARILEEIERYFIDHAPDETLSDELSGIRQRVRQFQETEKRCHEKSNAVRQCAGTLQALYRAFEYEIAQPEALLETLSAEYETLEQRNRELREEKNRRWRMQTLEEHRGLLREGTPCPLCGAREHPFAHHEPPKVDEIQQELDRSAGRSRELARSIASLRKIVPIRDELRRLENDLREALAHRGRDATEINEMIGGYGVLKNSPEVPSSEVPDFAAVLQSLQLRRETWKKNGERRVALLQERVAMRERREHFERTLRNVHDHVTETVEKRDNAARVLDELIAKRRSLFGEEDPDRSEQAFRKDLRELRLRQEQSRGAFEETEKRRTILRTTVDSLKTAVEHARSRRDALEANLRELFVRHGFRDEREYLAARLEADEQERIEGEVERLKNERTRLLGLIEEKRNALQEKREISRSEKSPEELRDEAIILRETRAGLFKDIGTVEERLRTDEALRETHRQLQDCLEAQDREFRRFSALSALIGSAQGDKFSRFAQGLTLELLLNHANRQLADLSDRYRLVRGDAPLEILVRDFDHAGEKRPTTNLSGGESFLVSLALALGLSQMMSEKMNTESLFLDEGFGTLDEETLHTVLSVLANLQRGGKLIGLISHVETLKERIPTQILVVPQPGGRSTIVGPGITHRP